LRSDAKEVTYQKYTSIRQRFGLGLIAVYLRPGGKFVLRTPVMAANSSIARHDLYNRF